MKDKDLIKKLFKAHERDFSNSLVNSAEYQEISNRRSIEEQKLLNSINKEQYMLYDRTISCYNEVVELQIEEAFKYGVSIIIQLLIEAMKW